MARGAESNLRSFFAAYSRLGFPDMLRVLGKVAGQLVDAHGRGEHFTALGPSTLFMFSRGTLTLASPTEGLPVPKGENLGERAANLEKWLRSSITDLLTAGDVVIEFSQYLAPEFFSSGTTDERSDIYAFGVLAYRLSTGRYPFASRTINELVAEKLDLQVRPPGDANFPSNPEFDSFIVRCLSLVPGERYTSAQAMLESLLKVPAQASSSLGSRAKLAVPPKAGDPSILGKMKDRIAAVAEAAGEGISETQDNSFLGRLKERIVNPVLGERVKEDDSLTGAEYIASPKEAAQERLGYHSSDEDEPRKKTSPAGYERDSADDYRKQERLRKPEKIHDALSEVLDKKLKQKKAEREGQIPFLGAGIPQLSPAMMMLVLVALTAIAGGGAAWLLSRLKSPPPPSALEQHLARLAQTPGPAAESSGSAGSAAKAAASVSSASPKVSRSSAKEGGEVKLTGMPAVGMGSDRDPPAAPEIMRPKPGENLADGMITFYGIAEELSTVEVSDNEVLIGRVRADSAWVWTFRPEQPLGDGEHRISVTATDEAGNKSKSAAEISIRVGRTPISTPVLLPTVPAAASEAAASVSGAEGSAEAGDAGSSSDQSSNGSAAGVSTASASPPSQTAPNGAVSSYSVIGRAK